MNEEDEADNTLMLIMGACSRRITNTWINPAKSREYYEDLRRVFFKDGSPEGLYPACVVTDNMLGQVVVIVPFLKFKELLEATASRIRQKTGRTCEKEEGIIPFFLWGVKK